MKGWECMYIHKEQGLFLSVYVDDFKMAGKENNVKAMWPKIREHLDLDPAEEFNESVYLGCGQNDVNPQPERYLEKKYFWNNLSEGKKPITQEEYHNKPSSTKKTKAKASPKPKPKENARKRSRSKSISSETKEEEDNNEQQKDSKERPRKRQCSRSRSRSLSSNTKEKENNNDQKRVNKEKSRSRSTDKKKSGQQNEKPFKENSTKKKKHEEL